MAWQITGQMIEGCSCNFFCPCWYGVKELMVMDQGWCAFTLTFRLQEGQADGIHLGGRTVVLAGDFPGPTILDGNGTARLYIDEAANADQRRELEAILQGKKGGPMAVLGELMATWLSTQTASIDVQVEGDTVTVDVGNVGQVKSQRLRDPEGQTFTLQGGGLIAGFQLPALDLAPSGTHWADPDMPRTSGAGVGLYPVARCSPRALAAIRSTPGDPTAQPRTGQGE